MWISDILIVINQHNSDRNTLLDIAAAVADTGASVVCVDEEAFTIEATAPADVVGVINAMEGVSYVRCVFSYHCDGPEPVQAA